MSIIKRLIIALALTAGITSAIAQAPAPVPALPDTERRTTYNISGTTCACNVNFALYGDGTDYQNWIEVWLNGVRVNFNDPTSGWTITSPSGSLANQSRPITDAVLTFANAQTGTVQIVGARRPRRTSQFNENAGVSARAFNQVLTDLVAQNRELWDKTNDVTGRAVLAPPGETLAILPKLASRASMGACFDSSGNLTSCVASSSGTFVAGGGIAFTGTNPTTISANLSAGSGVKFTGTNPIVISTSSQLTTPQDFGAVCDGVTNDAVALQNWANALRDGGLGASPSTAGCATSATITFMPSTNVAPVQGPHVVGNLKLIGHASLPTNNDLLRIWNPTAVTTSQNFYFPQFDSLELSNTTGTGSCLSVRGYWGSIGKILGTSCGGDVVQFPNFLFGGIPDEYESNPWLGDITGINMGGFVLDNLIGIGATPRAGNVRGTVASLAAGLGAINSSGSEKIVGAIAYSGQGWAVTVNEPPVPGIQTTPHEVFMEGAGDIDCAQNGLKIQEVEFATITGHRLNVEPPTFCNASSWPLTAYSFAAGANGRVVNATVNAYVTVRPGVTAGNIGTLFDFNNSSQINNLVLNVSINDLAGIISGMSFSAIYKNINSNSTIRIIQNGVVVYDNTTPPQSFASLPTCNAGLANTSRIVNDSNTTTFHANVAGGGAQVIRAVCLSNTWVVGG